MKQRIMLKGTLAMMVLSGMLAATALAEETAVPTAPLMTLSHEGYVSITLPNQNWQEVNMDDACVAFSDGKSIISFDHYLKDDDVWKPVVPDGATGYYHRSIDVCKDLKLVFEAYSESEEDMEQIKDAIAHAKVNTEMLPKDEKHEVVVENYSIEATDYMAYVKADELNVRPEGNKNSDPIGTLYRGDKVHVTGKVMINGAANGWVRIDFNGGIGYLSNDFLSDTPVDPQPNPQPGPNPDINGNVDHYETKYMSDGSPVKVVWLNDGRCLDMNGNLIEGVADATMKMADGTLIYDFDPTVQSLDDFIQNGKREPDVERETTGAGDIIVRRADGTDASTLIHEEGGGYVNSEGDAMSDNGDGTWTNMTDGTLWQ